MPDLKGALSGADRQEALWLEPVSLDLAWKEPAENLRRMRAEIQGRLKSRPEIPAGERLFVFPELTLTGFVTDEPRSAALSRESAPVRAVSDLAREFGTGILAGFPEPGSKDGSVKNTLLGFGPDGSIFADYQKLHLFTAGKPAESETYESGERGAVANYRGWRIGLGICFDLRFPELFQAYAAEGADVMVLPACWVGGPTKSQQFKSLAQAHAILTQSFFLAVNRSGSDPNFQYEGEAFFFGPRGEGFEGAGPFHLDPVLLEKARGLPVRASRRSRYEVRAQAFELREKACAILKR